MLKEPTAEGKPVDSTLSSLTPFRAKNAMKRAGVVAHVQSPGLNAQHQKRKNAMKK
jgi:hypothetical protein